jgi:hypothetical protein
MIIKNQVLRTHSVSLTTKRFNHDFTPMANIFKNSDLYIIAAFSNAHLKDEMYHITATTIFSETPFAFKPNIVMRENLTILNMNRLHLFVIEDNHTSANRTFDTGIVKSFCHFSD